MRKTAITALGAFTMLASVAFAAPPPNDIGTTGMGGGVYYNPSLHGDRPQPANHVPGRVVGTTDEGGGVYRVPGPAED